MVFYLFWLILHHAHFLLTFISSVIFFATVIIISIEDNKVTNQLFNHKILFFIGKLSYGVYVYHFLLISFFKEYIYENLHIYVQNGIIASTLYTILCTGISILIAWISWQVIEQPILKLKKDLAILSKMS